MRLVGSLIRKVVPRPSLRPNFDGAVQVANVTADDIHPDSAAGNVGDLRGGRQPWQEYQLKRSLLAHAGRGFRRQQTLFDGFPLERGGVEPAPVVGDLNRHAARLMKRSQGQLSGRVLAFCPAFLRRLETMVDGVADHVNQRIADLFEDGLVQLDSLAFDDEPDFLSERPREVSHQARESLENGLDRQHPNRHDAGLEFVGNAGDVRAGLFQVLHHSRAVCAVVQFLDQQRECAARNQQFADDPHQAIQLVLIDSNRRRRGGSVRPGPPELSPRVGRHRQAPERA